MLFTKVIHRRKPGFLNLSLLFNLAILPFGGLLLYGVARESGPKTATVVVHVTISDVVVRVGDHEFPIEEYTGEPIVCELPRGEHRLTMTQGDQMITVNLSQQVSVPIPLFSRFSFNLDRSSTAPLESL